MTKTWVPPVLLDITGGLMIAWLPEDGQEEYRKVRRKLFDAFRVDAWIETKQHLRFSVLMQPYPEEVNVAYTSIAIRQQHGSFLIAQCKKYYPRVVLLPKRSSFDDHVEALKLAETEGETL